MNLRRRHTEDAEVSTESLNDIMFFLLLFFLIISTLANPNVIKLMLPKSANNEQLAKQQVNLGVTKDKQYTINKKPVPFDQLEAAISAEIAGLDQPTVVLHFDRELSVQDLVDVMQIGTKIKVKMVLATQKQS
ncbi:MAG TPA: biopolymer transporter ExbD [Flavobacteriales bacterium]|nr:biopolymer transporter ExbD [Flavobacteriales bacterium]HMU14655.1 biopolymer transporter ExbD [Flavobacteriales bacterium]HMW96702.1 biopolymer transporter ExbD [Flavobacteriales bacterium]HNA31789.1 biopolymer transporter ExbD [Flavobacteriales bacterium]HNE82111.1 biopolymer transporter ExbD [Flavobacteriales bacterium]